MQLKKAEQILKKALKICDTTYGIDDQQEKMKAMTMCNLGEVIRLRSKFE
jgi:hypothetical protein